MASTRTGAHAGDLATRALPVADEHGFEVPRSLVSKYLAHQERRRGGGNPRIVRGGATGDIRGPDDRARPRRITRGGGAPIAEQPSHARRRAHTVV